MCEFKDMGWTKISFIDIGEGSWASFLTQGFFSNVERLIVVGGGKLTTGSSPSPNPQLQSLYHKVMLT